MKDRKITNLKSHDGHILMQDILPIALRVSMLSRAQTRVVKVVSDFCFFFKGLCAKVLDLDELDKMESQIALTLCEMEKLFPSSFFHNYGPFNYPLDIEGQAWWTRSL